VAVDQAIVPRRGALLARYVALSLGALLLLVGTAAGVVNREVLDADRFVAHVDAVRADPQVSARLGELLVQRMLAEQPDLVAIRPLLQSAAATVVASPALGPLVRTAVGPLHQLLVDGGQDPLVLRLADAAAAVVGVARVAAPEVGAALPADLDVRLSRVGEQDHAHEVLRWVHVVQWLSWLCPLLGLLLLAGSGATLGRPAGDPRSRALGAVAEVGRGTLASAAGLAVVLAVVGFVVGRTDELTFAGAVEQASWAELNGSFWLAAGLTGAAGWLMTLADRVGPTSLAPRAVLSAAWQGLLEPSPRTAARARRALATGLLGTALLLQPLAMAEALLWAAGAVLVGIGATQLVAAVVPAVRRRVRAGGWRPVATTLAVVAMLALVGAFAALAVPADEDLAPSASAGSSQACNGHVELCGRRYDEVAYPGTHNSMAAASEPGWFFPEQPDGIIDQLDHGIRVLLIDSWYGQQTQRPGVIANTEESRARGLEQAREAFGDPAVRSALRVRDALRLRGRGPVEAYLCHSLCELGSIEWLPVMRRVEEWLVAHPREVVTFFVQDEVTPADTAEIVREAGLLPFVYTPAQGGSWPTLGQMVTSGKRVVFLMENHGGGTTYPWMLDGFTWAQDTPFLFESPADFSCAANRGLPDAPLFLVNHWITDKAREVTNARQANAVDVLVPRLEECESARDRLPNFVAVDFYDQGDLFPAVDGLNRLDSASGG
jgi:hypothetical protein